jgi:ribose transport system ATP-binding protein
MRNICLVNLDSLKKGLLLDYKKIKKQAEDCVSQLRIKTENINKVVGELSGGNQQKVVIGKWMNVDADIYVFDEPTRGIDVGAKIEVYNIINKLVEQNKCVIMISSELPEIIGMSDRVIVMRSGKIMAEIDRVSDNFNQEDIMKAAWGGKL